MIRQCGWPGGDSIADGPCGAPTAVVYVVRVTNLPLDTADDETHQAALGLCTRHAAIPDPPLISDDEPMRA